MNTLYNFIKALVKDSLRLLSYIPLTILLILLSILYLFLFTPPFEMAIPLILSVSSAIEVSWAICEGKSLVSGTLLNWLKKRWSNAREVSISTNKVKQLENKLSTNEVSKSFNKQYEPYQWS